MVFSKKTAWDNGSPAIQSMIIRLTALVNKKIAKLFNGA